MMNFISLVLGIVVGQMMTMAVTCVIMVQPRFIKWYMKYFKKQMNNIMEVGLDELFNEEEA